MTDRYIREVLTIASARLGQRVEVYVHPHVDPCPYLGATGTIKEFPHPQHIRAIAGVKLDQYPDYREANGHSVTWIPLHQLTPID